MANENENNDLYIRQDLVSLGIPDEASIVGVGGTGTWSGLWLAMVGVKKIHLFDDDILANHNRSRLPYPPEWVHKKKTTCLKRLIRWVRPDTHVYEYGGIYNVSHLPLLSGIVFDCNDDINIQKLIEKYCKDNKLRYIGVGCNADHITVKENISKIWTVGDGQDRYQVTPMFIVPPVIASMCALWNVAKNKKDISVMNTVSYMFTDAHKKDKAIKGICSRCIQREECDGCDECKSDVHIPCIHCPTSTEEGEN